MAGGSWLGPYGQGGAVPAPLLAWEKDYLGWITVNTSTPSKRTEQQDNIPTFSIKDSILSVNINEKIPTISITDQKLSIYNISTEDNHMVFALLSIAITGIAIGFLFAFKRKINKYIPFLIIFILLIFPIFSCFPFLYDVPPTPTGLTASDGTYPDKIFVSWDTVYEAEEYYIYYSMSENGSYTVIGDGIPSGTSSINIVDIEDSVIYWFKVRASNESGMSDFSNADSGYAQESTVNPPSAPSGLTASKGTYTDKIVVSWNSVSNATQYRYYYSSSQSGTYTEFGTPGTATSINVTGITQDTIYWFKVKAENSGGLSGFSNADSGYTTSSTGNPPSAPSGLTASKGTYTDKIVVSWNSVSDATQYRYYYSSSQSGTYTEFGTPGTATSINVTGVTAGTTYWFKVKAENSYGLSDFSNADSGYIATSSGSGTLLTEDVWEIGNISTDGEEWFYFNASAGTSYNINWDDSYEGSNNYTADIKVSAYREDQTTSYFVEVDSGYNNPQTIVASASEIVYIKVVGYYSSTTGSFAVKYKQSGGSSGGNVTLEDIETSNTAIKVILGDSGKQYYLIENKVKITGTWTQYLPAGGLLISHIDENFTTSSNFWNNDVNAGDVHGVAIMEADNDNNLWDGTGSSAGDTYKSPQTLTPTSSPSSKLNSSTVQWGGIQSGISITNISAAGSTMTFDVSN
jgi:hypothetical protein